MKKTVILTAVLIVVLMAGCQDPIRNYVIASNAVTGAAEGGTILVKAGAMGADEAAEYAKLLDKADSILKIARLAINVNSVPDLSTVDLVIDKLIDMQTAAIKRRKGE